MSDEIKDGDGLFIDTKPTPARPVGVPAKKDVKKRWILLGIGATGFALIVSSLLSNDPPQRTPREQPTPMIDLTPRDADQRSWQVRSQAEIERIRTENERLARDLRTMRSELERIKANPPVVAPPETPSPPAEEEPSTPPLSQPPVPPPPLPPGVTDASPTAPPPVPPPFSTGPSVVPEPLVFTPPIGAAIGPEVEANIRYRQNESAGLLVAGAFAPVAILNGIDAGTSSGSRSNPMPLLMRVQDHAVLPGASNYSLRSCFALGSGYGELSAERVYVRLARLSCVDRDDRLVLSVPIQGYIVDSDGVLGLRGQVVDRQGARLGKALLAGFAEGLSSALGGAQGTITSSVLGNTTSVTGSEAMRASGLAGASTAAGQLAEFYLNEAQNIFPVITVAGGRTATIVITEDVGLEWGNIDAKFVRDVQPQNQR